MGTRIIIGLIVIYIFSLQEALSQTNKKENMDSTEVSKSSFYDNLRDRPEKYEIILNDFLNLLDESLKIEDFDFEPYQFDKTLDYVDYYRFNFTLQNKKYEFVVFNEPYLDSHVLSLILNKIISNQERSDDKYFIDAVNVEMIYYSNESKHRELISDNSCNILPDSELTRLDGFLFIYDSRYKKIYNLNKFDFEKE